MKKSILWMAVAILTCGLAFTACTVEDNPNPEPLGKQPVVIDFASLVEKYANKTKMTISDAVVENVGTCSIVDGQLSDGSGTASEEIDPHFALQTGTNWILYTSGGLYSMNGGGRSFGILDCEAGSTVTIEVTAAPALTKGSAELVSNDGEVYVYNVTEAGNLIFSLARYNTIKKIVIE